MKNFALVVFITFLCNACASSTHYIQTKSQAYSPTNSDNIRIYAGEDVLDSYVVIGSVAVHVPGNGDKAVAELKKEAAKIGADAIIAFQLDKINSFSWTTEASGVAIKIK